MTKSPVITATTDLKHGGPGFRCKSDALKYVHIIRKEVKPEAYPGAPEAFETIKFINYEDDQMTTITADGFRIILFNNPTIEQAHDLATYERMAEARKLTPSATARLVVSNAEEFLGMKDRYGSDLSYLTQKLKKVTEHPYAPGLYRRTGALCTAWFVPHGLEFTRKQGGTNQIAERHCVVIWDGSEVRMISTDVFEDTYTTPQEEAISRHELPQIRFDGDAAKPGFGSTRYR